MDRHSPSDPVDLLREVITVAELARHNDPEHGWWLAVGDTVYDGSLRGRLDRLRRGLLEQ